MRIATVLVLATAMLAAGTVVATAAAPPDTKICAQISGPHARYHPLVSGIKSDGSTWTVIVTGVDCKYAVAKAPGLLKQWTKAKLGARLTLKGASCLKMIDAAYSGSGTSSGGLMRHLGTSPPVSIFGPKTFAVRETSPYSIAQIKAFFGIR
jgi:hypothetical protein